MPMPEVSFPRYVTLEEAVRIAEEKLKKMRGWLTAVIVDPYNRRVHLKNHKGELTLLLDESRVIVDRIKGESSSLLELVLKLGLLFTLEEREVFSAMADETPFILVIKVTDPREIAARAEELREMIEELRRLRAEREPVRVMVA